MSKSGQSQSAPWPEHIQAKIVRELLDWYRENRRHLPWRDSSDPYRIWISEIMLQQTRVESALPYYQRFIQRFPTLNTLAAASEEQVLELWKGLGYYSRARSLLRMARVLVEDYQGCFPENYTLLRKLPGIGPYTAGAILSIAFNRPHPAVDGNVLRVITRLGAMEDDISQTSTRNMVEALVAAMMPAESASDFTQALMELGAVQCTSKKPACTTCRLSLYCLAFSQGLVNQIPIKKLPKRPLPLQSFWVVMIVNGDQILLEYRKNDTLLGKLWGLPIVEKNGLETPERQLQEKYMLDVQLGESLGTVQHVFTHRIWMMEGVTGVINHDLAAESGLTWKNMEQILHLAIPVAFQKILHLLRGK